MALAMKGERRDTKKQIEMIEAIREDIITAAKSLGGKIRKKKQPKPIETDGLPTVKEAIAMLGGSGTVLTYNRRK